MHPGFDLPSVVTVVTFTPACTGAVPTELVEEDERSKELTGALPVESPGILICSVVGARVSPSFAGRVGKVKRRFTLKCPTCFSLSSRLSTLQHDTSRYVVH